jgi:hypothetical protein
LPLKDSLPARKKPHPRSRTFTIFTLLQAMDQIFS